MNDFLVVGITGGSKFQAAWNRWNRGTCSGHGLASRRARALKTRETAAMLEQAAALEQQALPRMVTIPARHVLEHVNMSVQHNHYQAPAAWPPAGFSMLMALTFGQKASAPGIH